MIIGIVIGVFVIITCLMILTKRCKNKHFQKWNHVSHKFIGFGALILSILHLYLVWPLRQQRPIEMFIVGIIMTVVMMVIIAAYYLRKKLGKSWRLVHRYAAFAVVLCLAAHVYIGVHSFQVYNEKIGNIAVQELDLAEVADGEYLGEEDVDYIFCKVKVTVKGHALVAVDILEHRNERGEPAEAVIEEMVKEETVKVDAVTGATNSSKVIMKAVENALKSENNQ